MPKGKTSLFREDFPDLARKLCLLGAIDRDLARIFEVSVRTISNWKRQHPEFAAALKSGKAEADGAVAEALYRKAVKGEMMRVNGFLGLERTGFFYRLARRLGPEEPAGQLRIFSAALRAIEDWKLEPYPRPVTKSQPATSPSRDSHPD